MSDKRIAVALFSFFIIISTQQLFCADSIDATLDNIVSVTKIQESEFALDDSDMRSLEKRQCGETLKSWWIDTTSDYLLESIVVQGPFFRCVQMLSCLCFCNVDKS